MKAQILQAVAPLREQVETELAKLQPRERVIVIGGSILAALAFVYLAIWKPVELARHNGEKRLADAREIAVQLQRASSIVPRSAGAQQLGGGSLLATVDQASKSGDLGKPLSRLSPEGDAQVRAWVEDVQFDSLMRWISSLQSRYGVRVDSVEIERQPTPGLVNARLSLVKGS
jgi:general secretion pathway protein M